MNWLEKLRINGKYIAMGNIVINKTVGKINNPIATVIGSLLLLVVIFFSFFIPCPTRTQYLFLRIGFSFGVTLALLPLLGNITIGKHNYKGFSTLLFFMFTYLANPAATITKDICNINTPTEGTVYLGDKPLKDAVIIVPQYDYKTISNSSGKFWIQWKEKKNKKDSLLIKVQSSGIDTSFYWNQANIEMLITIPDTLLPLSKKIIRQLLTERVDDFDNFLKGKHLEWKVDSAINIETLFRLYNPFESFEAKYRNEFKFKSLDQDISFRKNLKAAGIQVVDQLKPFEKHSFDSCTTYILKSAKFPEYELNYLLKNEKDVDFTVNKLQFITENQYKARVSYKENIRQVRVLLNCSKKTNGYKTRQMEVYGFLPEEELELKFINGKWLLTKPTNI